MFYELIDIHSLGADDVSLVGPTGPVGPLSVTKLNDVTYEVALLCSVRRGSISCWLARQLWIWRNLLDQNGNGTGGEVPGDQYASSFTVETSLRLDFGKATSPVAGGYKRVLETDVYAESVGYGWQDGTMTSYDRSSGGELLRDFHYAPQARSWWTCRIDGMKSCSRWVMREDCTIRWPSFWKVLESTL